ncbi:imidazole glycerol phosphate synthase subunit HisH [Azospirillum sp.]|uniref:imidazole glycerol phosphate synthase subunit HisH n=1 Tax=Azospirillum sp. TaxID=34012 RepID=UPI003D70B220
MTTSVLIVDHGLCNLDSIGRALTECGARVAVSADPKDIAGAGRLVLPGVGTFARGMANLHDRGLAAALHEGLAQHPRPLLGVCLGLQLLAEWGAEGAAGDEGTPGLGLIPGRVERLDPRPGERLPHVGWNQVHPRRDHPLFRGVADGADVYFVHSFALRCPEENRLAETDYAGGFTAAAANGLVCGVQFHPEKSQHVGFTLIRNFLAM